MGVLKIMELQASEAAKTRLSFGGKCITYLNLVQLVHIFSEIDFFLIFIIKQAATPIYNNFSFVEVWNFNKILVNFKIVLRILQMFDAIVPSDAFTKPNEEKAFCLLRGDCSDR